MPVRGEFVAWVSLRRTHPELLSAVVSLALVLSLPAQTGIRLFVWMAMGVAIYFGLWPARGRRAPGPPVRT